MVVLSGDGVSVRTSAQFANVLEENSHQFPLPVEKVSVGKLHVSVQFNLVPRLFGQFSIVPRLLGILTHSIPSSSPGCWVSFSHPESLAPSSLIPRMLGQLASFESVYSLACQFSLTPR